MSPLLSVATGARPPCGFEAARVKPWHVPHEARQTDLQSAQGMRQGTSQGVYSKRLCYRVSCIVDKSHRGSSHKELVFHARLNISFGHRAWSHCFVQIRMSQEILTSTGCQRHHLFTTDLGGVSQIMAIRSAQLSRTRKRLSTDQVTWTTWPQGNRALPLFTRQGPQASLQVNMH
jgi:hypothetical protein